MADKKEEVKKSDFKGTVISPFTVRKKDYKVSDIYDAKDQDSLDYLKRIKKVK